MALSKGEVTRLQNALNAFVKKYKGLGYAPLRVDGQFGRHTKALLRSVKYDLGYRRENLNVKVDDNFYHRLANPTKVEPKWGQTREVVKRGRSRRRDRRKHVRRDRIKAFLKPGVTTFDGVPVAKCAVPVLKWCREHGWHGVLVSGWRSAEHSEHLCFVMCGRPSCPGKCAGRATNHTGDSPERFALDVSDYVNFGHVVAECPIKPHVHNALPNDLVHFSPSGH